MLLFLLDPAHRDNRAATLAARRATAPRTARLASTVAEFYVCCDNNTPSMVAQARNVHTNALLLEVRTGGEGYHIAKLISLRLSTESNPRSGDVCISLD